MIITYNMSVFYGDTLALEDVSLEIEAGTITGIIGPNGAGKSTLLKGMLNIVPHSGAMLLDGEQSPKKLKRIAYVEQKSNIDYTFPIKVKECVSLGTYSKMKVFQKVKKKEWLKVTQALETVNMSAYENHQISELSGGQFQRVLLARCLVQEADYFFLDEPFVGIDSVSERIIMETLLELKKQGKTILIVHHDLSKAKTYFDHLVILNKQMIAHGETMQVFNETNLKHAYGENLFVGVS